MNWIDRMNNNALKWHAEKNDIPIENKYYCSDCREEAVELDGGKLTCGNTFCESYMEKLTEEF